MTDLTQFYKLWKRLIFETIDNHGIPDRASVLSLSGAPGRNFDEMDADISLLDDTSNDLSSWQALTAEPRFTKQKDLQLSDADFAVLESKVFKNLEKEGGPGVQEDDGLDDSLIGEAFTFALSPPAPRQVRTSLPPPARHPPSSPAASPLGSRNVEASISKPVSTEHITSKAAGGLGAVGYFKQKPTTPLQNVTNASRASKPATTQDEPTSAKSKAEDAIVENSLFTPDQMTLLKLIGKSATKSNAPASIPPAASSDSDHGHKNSIERTRLTHGVNDEVKPQAAGKGMGPSKAARLRQQRLSRAADAFTQQYKMKLAADNPRARWIELCRLDELRVRISWNDNIE